MKKEQEKLKKEEDAKNGVKTEKPKKKPVK